MPDQDKIKESLAALKDFFDQFGENDIYKEIFLEELFKFILEEYGKPTGSAASPESPQSH